MFFDSATSSASNITAIINSIPMLNGTNFKTWHENLHIVLGVMDLDLALRVSSPTPLTVESSSDEKRDIERWEKSNRMCLMSIKKAIPEAFRGTISEKIKTAKEFLEEIKNRFAKNEKSETSTLLENFISMRYKGNGNIREYIMEMSHLASKLRAHKLDLSEDLLVHLVLISLPRQFSQFKVSYNCQKETWSLNELISHCVQEEERLKKKKIESSHLTDTSKDKGKKRKKDKEAAKVPYLKKQHKKNNVDGCFFCRAVGHKKKQCTNYHAWRAKKGTLLNLVCFEVNLTSVPKHTWWIDSGATTHISVSMQGCLSCRKPNDGERYIFVGDGKKVEVEAIGTFRLFLKSGTYLDLNETYLYRPFDGIWFLFPYWKILVILVLLEIINLVFFRIQIWLVLVLYLM